MDKKIENFVSTQEERFAGIERILQEVQNIIDNNEKFKLSWCKIKAQAMNKYWDRIITAHEEMTINELPEAYLETKTRLEEEYEDALIILQEVITPNKSKGEIKLPRIEIPEFRGDYFEWVNFKDLFVALVIDNESLSGVQRMQLLKSALKGEAKDLVSELILSNANFDVAWGKLVHRFENLKVVVQLFLKKVITLPHLKPDNSDSAQIKQLLDKTDQALEALRNLGRPVEKWDDWIIMIISHKLNEELRREWEKRVGNLNSLPLWTNLKEFLEEEYRIAESLEKSKKKPHQKFQKTNNVSVNQAAIEKEHCPNCKHQHSIYNCEGFKEMSAKERWALVKEEKLCYRCLRTHEDFSSCKNVCKKCSEPHSTWLHEETAQNQQISSNIALIQQNEIMVNAMKTTNQPLLPTALITVMNNAGQFITLRAVIDFGSQGSMITTDATMLLKLVPFSSNTVILPVGGGPTIAAKTVNITIKPRFNSNFELTVKCYCLKKIMNALPEADFETEQWPHLSVSRWADPSFNKSGQVDVLLGVDTINQLLLSGLKKGEIGEPIAQNSELGWIISGRLDNSNNKRMGIKCLVATTQESNADLQKFCELEDSSPQREPIQDESRCDELYDNGYSRDQRGKLTVSIPLKEGDLGPSHLGNSRRQALARFETLEMKLAKIPELKKEYTRIMNEYLTLDQDMHLVEETTKICPLLEGETPMKKSSEQPRKKTPDPQSTYWKTRSLRPRPLRSMLWLAIVGLFIVFTGGLGDLNSKHAPAKISKFKNHPGIYFENLGHAGVITTKWHIYLKFELELYHYEMKLLQDSINDLKKLCHHQSHCQEISDRLAKDITEIKRSNKLLQANEERRMKRHVPLGIVGWIQHNAFGVMDEDNADQIETQFKKIDENENHILALIRNQTNAADITLNVLKTTQQNLYENYDKIEQMLNKMQNATDIADETENMLGLAVYLTLMVQNMERFQNSIVTFLTDLQQGHVNPQLFTPDQLLDQLKVINNNLPIGSKIPETPQDDLRSFYQLLTGKARVTKTKIIFDMTLPLISTDEYEIMRIIPVPTKHGDHRVSIQPESEFLMITLERDKFYQMGKTEYNSCLTLATMKKICTIQRPNFNSQSSRSQCERDLLAQKTSLNNDCRFEITNEEDVWIHLQDQNEWIYGIDKELTLNIVCDNEATPVTIEGTGIIQIKPGCKMIHPEMTITAEAHKFSKDSLNFIPSMNLSSTMVKKNLPALNLTIDHSLQLQQLHEQLKNIHDQTFVERVQHYAHFGNHLTFWIVITGIALTLWIKREQLRKLCNFMATYMITSSGHLITTSWQNQRIQRRQLPDNSIQFRSLQVLASRGQDVQDGHNSL